jgi:hypothetical protein
MRISIADCPDLLWMETVRRAGMALAKKVLATLTIGSLNQITQWLREINLLRQAQLACATQAADSAQSRLRSQEHLEATPQSSQNRLAERAEAVLGGCQACFKPVAP